ncbi:MAG: four helix bundle protein [Ruminococcaceae bacterium]|nr:four helix bundle protein [Oscillospiraceae bacterium]
MVHYKDLTAWQKSMELVKEVYCLVKKLPKEETYSLSDQMRRAAVSIPSNIAEGNGRKSLTDYARFLDIARGSEYELETQLQICVMLGYLTEKDTEKAFDLIAQVGKMLHTMINKVLKQAKAQKETSNTTNTNNN